MIKKRLSILYCLTRYDLKLNCLGVQVVAEEVNVKLYEQIFGCVPTRLIIESLKSGEKSFKDIHSELEKNSEGLGEMVTRLHLSLLEMKGLVEKTDKGNEKYFKLTDKWKKLEEKIKSQKT